MQGIIYRFRTTCKGLYLDFAQQTCRQIGDLAGTVYWGAGKQIGDMVGILGIWQGDWGSGRQIGIWKVYWGSGNEIGDLASKLGIWQVYWGSGKYIGDLACILGICHVYGGSGTYIGDLARILGIWHVCWGSGTYIGDLARRLVNYNWWTLYNDLSSLSTSAELSKLSFFTFHSKNCFTKKSVSSNLLKRNLNPVRLV